MTQYQNVFQRHEKKYRLSLEQYKDLKKELEKHMIPDDHGSYKICNLYLDTRDYSLIRTSLEKPLYKEKLRLRSYGVPDEENPVYLEIKKKVEGIVYKRRIQIPHVAAINYLTRGIKPDRSSQVLMEMDWFMALYKPEPKAYISYDRVALSGVENPDLRVTFDRNILYRDTDLDLTKGSWGMGVLDPLEMLMEIKIPESMPLWLASLLSDMEIYPSSFSKYGTCYQKFVMGDQLKGGILHAS